MSRGLGERDDAQTGCALGLKCTYACGGSGAVIACVADGTTAGICG